MKITLLITLFITSLTYSALAQKPNNGVYQSYDGAYSFSLTVLDDQSLEVVEPNKTSIYKRSGNAYQHTEEKYSNFMMRIASPTELYTFKSGNPNESKFTWIGSGEISEEDCPLYDKYLELAENEDDPEVQAYTFCAAAAIAKCSYTAEGFLTYAAGFVIAMKQIIVDISKCPCTDVIPQSIWNAN